WKNIPGGLSRISAGSATNVWRVNSGGNIYRYTGDDSNPWVHIPGGLSDIGAAADGTVWGVNSAGNIYRYTGDTRDPNGWVHIAGGLSAISVGTKTNHCVGAICSQRVGYVRLQIQTSRSTQPHQLEYHLPVPVSSFVATIFNR
ncbi:hypothetical protein C8J57DRAFT_1165425, partial [Mycena rebaudengoi]